MSRLPGPPPSLAYSPLLIFGYSSPRWSYLDRRLWCWPLDQHLPHITRVSIPLILPFRRLYASTHSLYILDFFPDIFMPSTLNMSILTVNAKVGWAIWSSKMHLVFTAITYKEVGQQHMGLWHIDLVNKVDCLGREALGVCGTRLLKHRDKMDHWLNYGEPGCQQIRFSR